MLIVRLFILISVVVLSSCQESRTPILPQAALTYPIGDNRYAVVVVAEPNASVEATRARALDAAAELTLGQGFRYFVVDREQPVELLQSMTSEDDAPFNANLYQELIIEKNGTPPPNPVELRSALRLEIRVFKEKPNGETSIDAFHWADSTR